MFRYNLMYKLTEEIPGKINDFLLDLIFLELKNDFSTANDGKIKKEDLDRDFFLVYIIFNLGNSDKNKDKYYKRLLNKMNSKSILKKYIRLICNDLHEKNYDDVNELLNSVVCSNLVKEAKLIKQDEQDYIVFTLHDNKEVKFSHIPIDEVLIDQYREQCHKTVYNYIKNEPSIRNAIVTLEKDLVFGNYYHSIMVEDDMVYDYAQNVMISYEDYINLFKPKVLVSERGNELIKNMQLLEEKIHYSDSKWFDLIAYGIYKQLGGKNKHLRK